MPQANEPLISQDELLALHLETRARAFKAHRELKAAQTTYNAVSSQLAAYATLLQTYYDIQVDAYIDVKEN